MAKRIVLRLLPFLALLLVSCGNGGSPSPNPGPGPKLIDPSGNWTMTATDSGGRSVKFAALYAQVGANVSANSFTSLFDSTFTCTPFSAALSGGLVQNVDNFTGTVTFGGGFGAFTFTTMLAQDGKSFTGTYSNMPGCTGLLPTGAFTGAEVPSTSAVWTGTIQNCTYDQQTGICTTAGTTAPFSATLSQNDVTGNVTGNYQVSGAVGFSSGTVQVRPGIDILSGLLWEFTITDVSGNTAGVCGGCTPGANGSGLSGLDLSGHFEGLVSVQPINQTSTHYWLVASH